MQSVYDGDVFRDGMLVNEESRKEVA